jgi:hypothetical protein
MPLRVRTLQNKIINLPPEARFLELVDDRHRLLALAYTDEQGLERVLESGDPLFDRYCRMFGLIRARATDLTVEEPR